MNSALLVLIALVFFYLAYRVYGRHLSRDVFETEGEAATPAHEFSDGVDYVPSRPLVLFGHHFASIAGLGPIVGPAIAVAWGWAPVTLWILLGCVFLGAVHDFAALALSLKHSGRGIGDLTGMVLGPRGRILFLIVIFFLLALAMGVFALIVGQLFAGDYPETVIPVFSLIAVAMGAGYGIYRLRMGIGLVTVLALPIVFLSIWAGIRTPVSMYKLFVPETAKIEIAAALDAGTLESDAKGPAVAAALEAVGRVESAMAVKAAIASATTAWVIILLAYAFAASVLPVWLLLQPRDYLNSYQLYLGLGGLFVGAMILHPTIAAPAFRSRAEVQGLPSFFPLLFITVACGAISGFHNLVSSGTTARQINRRRDGRLIAYGAMLVEGFLAILVIAACTAGVGGSENWRNLYSNWGTLTGGLANQTRAFFAGAGQFLSVFGIAPAVGAALMATVVVGFAMTTLDSGTRLLRYNIEEIADTVNLKRLVNRYLASILAVVVLAGVALLKVPATGADGALVYKPAGIILWQLFGTSNQLLACLGLLVASVYLVKAGKPAWYTALPFAFMLVVTGWSMIAGVKSAWNSAHPELRSWPLVTVGAVLIVVTVWLAIEAVVTVVRTKRAGVLRAVAEPVEP